MNKENDTKQLATCDECGSEYYLLASSMANLCTECSHICMAMKNATIYLNMEGALNAFGTEAGLNTSNN